ncbi:MAG: SDR family oxidoreductase [Candidatus Omnitrophica bacterium]|nr:SDR family oxidoreductase [Candidatus Omnitrophota bacterium]
MKKNKGNKFSLSGKTAIVTGALGLLGRNFCFGLAEEGADIAAVDLNPEECARFALKLKKKYQVKAAGFHCDVADALSVSEMAESVKNKFGRIDILINSACYRSQNPKLLHARFEDYSPEEWQRMMEVNVTGVFLCSQAAGKVMLKQNSGGSIIQISSIYGLLGTDHRIYKKSDAPGKRTNNPAVYSASKGAVISLTKYLASYWADKGIRVNVISPGGVENKQDKYFIQAYSSRVPMQRMAKAKELVGALIYLASDASSYVTGQNIIVDGGLSIW